MAQVAAINHQELQAQQVRCHRPSVARPDSRRDLFELQRLAGNRAVAGLLTRQAVAAPVTIQGDWLDDASELVGGAVDTAAGAAGQVADTAGAVASGVADTAGQAASGAAGVVGGIVGDIPGAVTGVVGQARETANGVVDAAVDTAAGVASGVARGVGGAVDAGSAAVSGLIDGAGGVISGLTGGERDSDSGDRGDGLPPVVASILPGGTGDWHEVAQALTIAIAGLDLLPFLPGLAQQAITSAGLVTAAGGDYGPQNALRHCIFAGLVTSTAWRVALAEMGAGIVLASPLLLAAGGLMSARVQIILQAHEWFADDGCGNFGTGTVDSTCDQHNNQVGIGIGGPFTDDASVIAQATAALNGGRLLMTPGPTDLSRTVSTAGWPTSPWMAGGPQQPDCSKVTKK